MRFLFLLVCLVSTGAFAATQGSFILRGTVAKTCEVTVTAKPIAGTLDLTGSGHSAVNVASIVSSSNSLTGMKLTIAGDTAGTLVNQSDATKSIPYTLQYAGTSTGNNKAAFSVTTTATDLDQISAAGAINGELAVNITANSSLPSGVYEANVTVSCVTL